MLEAALDRAASGEAKQVGEHEVASLSDCVVDSGLRERLLAKSDRRLWPLYPGGRSREQHENRRPAGPWRGHHARLFQERDRTAEITGLVEALGGNEEPALLVLRVGVRRESQRLLGERRGRARRSEGPHGRSCLLERGGCAPVRAVGGESEVTGLLLEPRNEGCESSVKTAALGRRRARPGGRAKQRMCESQPVAVDLEYAGGNGLRETLIRMAVRGGLDEREGGLHKSGHDPRDV